MFACVNLWAPSVLFFLLHILISMLLTTCENISIKFLNRILNHMFFLRTQHFGTKMHLLISSNRNRLAADSIGPSKRSNRKWHLSEIFKTGNCNSQFEYSKKLVWWKNIWEAWNIKQSPTQADGCTATQPKPVRHRCSILSQKKEDCVASA